MLPRVFFSICAVGSLVACGGGGGASPAAAQADAEPRLDTLERAAEAAVLSSRFAISYFGAGLTERDDPAEPPDGDPEDPLPIPLPVPLPLPLPDPPIAKAREDCSQGYVDKDTQTYDVGSPYTSEQMEVEIVRFFACREWLEEGSGAPGDGDPYVQVNGDLRGGTVADGGVGYSDIGRPGNSRALSVVINVPGDGVDPDYRLEVDIAGRADRRFTETSADYQNRFSIGGRLRENGVIIQTAQLVFGTSSAPLDSNETSAGLTLSGPMRVLTDNCDTGLASLSVSERLVFDYQQGQFAAGVLNLNQAGDAVSASFNSDGSMLLQMGDGTTRSYSVQQQDQIEDNCRS